MRQHNVDSSLSVTDSGNKHILVMMDYFSKKTEMYALRNQEAAAVADVLVKEFSSRLYTH